MCVGSAAAVVGGVRVSVRIKSEAERSQRTKRVGMLRTHVKVDLLWKLTPSKSVAFT